MTSGPGGNRGLEFTGERYVPEVTGNIRLEHLHRYLVACELARDRSVLDIACGEGYGSDLLASVATSVIGVDLAPDVLRHAHRRYRQPNVRFVAGNCTAIPVATQSIDVVVSFETLEHHEQHDEMMLEIKRVLRPQGLLIISSPDRTEYSDIPDYKNPFHARELYRDEFEALLKRHFRGVSIVGQRIRAGSIVAPLDQPSETVFLGFSENSRERPHRLGPPLYLIGVATAGQVPPIPIGLLEGGDFVWSADQTAAIRALLDQHRSETEHAKIANEAAVRTLAAEVERQTAQVATFAADKARAEERVEWLQKEVERRGRRLEELDGEMRQLQATNESVHSIRAELEGRIRALETSLSWQLTAPLRRMRQFVGGPASDPPHQQSVDTPLPGHPPGNESPAPEIQNRTVAEPSEPAATTVADSGVVNVPVDRTPISEGSLPDEKQRRSIVVVSHDAHFYGAQRVALFLARTLSRELGYEVDTILCGGGPLRPEFESVGPVHDFTAESSTPERQAEIIRGLHQKGARIALCNTSCVGGVVHELKVAGFTTVSLIHELPGLIGQYRLEDSVATIARDADKVVFAASVVRDRFVEMSGLASDKAIIRPQGLLTRNRYDGRYAEARKELRARLGLGEHMKVALAVGSAHRRKGPDLFVDVGLQVIRQRDDVAFVWVGHRDGDGFADAEAKVAAAGAGAHFFFPGVIEDSDVFFAGADVYLMTSREDPFPSVVLHALDAELPVIGFNDAGGFVELLRRGCGILVPYLDTSAMAVAALELLSPSADRRKMTAIGKEIVSLEFDFRSYVHDLVSLAQGPRVSVVVPNYNYAHHLPTRLRSILSQTFRPHEIIFLDDCSSDRSLDVAEELLGGGSIPFRILRNDRNRGVYHQWLRGLAESTGDLVWIAEADDDCSPRFLETLVPSFARPEVVLAYSQSKQMDDAGREIAPDYLGWTDDVSRTKWRHAYVRSGIDEIRDSLAVKNTIPNVSAVVMRRPNLGDIETELLELRNAGDWLVYVHLLEHGDVAFIPQSLNYHRRHSASVTIGHGGLNLMRETLLVQRRVLDRHEIPAEVECKRQAHLQATYDYLGLGANGPASYKDHEALRTLVAVSD